MLAFLQFNCTSAGNFVHLKLFFFKNILIRKMKIFELLEILALYHPAARDLFKQANYRRGNFYHNRRNVDHQGRNRKKFLGGGKVILPDFFPGLKYFFLVENFHFGRPKTNLSRFEKWEAKKKERKKKERKKKGPLLCL